MAMKRESRILLHTRIRGYDFIAVLRGGEGIEHLRIVRIQGGVKDLVGMIAGEGFFHEVKYVVTYPQELSSIWLEAMRDLGRSDIKIDSEVVESLREILETYVDVLSRIAESLDKIQGEVVSNPA